MQIKYHLVSETHVYKGKHDLNILDMDSGHDETNNEYYIKFPLHVVFKTASKARFEAVNNALLSILSGENDDALLIGIGSILSGPEAETGLAANLAEGHGIFANSRTRSHSPKLETNSASQDSSDDLTLHSNSPELSLAETRQR